MLRYLLLSGIVYLGSAGLDIWAAVHITSPTIAVIDYSCAGVMVFCYFSMARIRLRRR